MRGNRQSAVRTQPSDAQKLFAGLSRHRRAKLSKVAQTTLVKADQWARAATVSTDVASALENALKSLKPKKA